MIEFTIGRDFRIPSGGGFRLWWPLYLALAIFLPPFFLFLPIRAPAPIVLLGFLILSGFAGLFDRFFLRPALRGPPCAS
jgi:hypothetical protein